MRKAAHATDIPALALISSMLESFPVVIISFPKLESSAFSFPGNSTQDIYIKSICINLAQVKPQILHIYMVRLISAICNQVADPYQLLFRIKSNTFESPSIDDQTSCFLNLPWHVCSTYSAAMLDRNSLRRDESVLVHYCLQFQHPLLAVGPRQDQCVVYWLKTDGLGRWEHSHRHLCGAIYDEWQEKNGIIVTQFLQQNKFLGGV